MRVLVFICPRLMYLPNLISESLFYKRHVFKMIKYSDKISKQRNIFELLFYAVIYAKMTIRHSGSTLRYLLKW